MHFLRQLGMIIIVILVTGVHSPAKTILFNSPQGGDFEFKTSASEKQHTKNLRGKNILLVFGFTNCKSVCPFTLKTIQKVFESIPPEQKSEHRVIFISVDNERDRYEKIKSYLAQYGENFIGGTEADSKLKKILNQYGARYYRYRTSSGALLVDHTSSIFVINKLGIWTQTLNYDASPNEIKSALNQTNEIKSKENLYPESRKVELIPFKKCLLNKGSCSVQINPIKYDIQISTNVIRPNTTYQLSVKPSALLSSGDWVPVEADIQGVELSMGYNRPVFKWNAQLGRYETDFEIPQCELSKMNWTATLIFGQNKKYKALQLQLQSEDP